MKKFISVIIIMLSVSVFAVDWYSGKEKVTDLKMKRTESKDTLWYSYTPDLYYLWNLNAERATFFNVNDFGLEYPININAISSYLYDDGYNFTYKIYAKDGVTLLFESAPDTSAADYNDYFLDSAMVMTDDFWVSVNPDTSGAGKPRQVTSSELATTHSYTGSGDGNWEPFFDGTDYYEFVTYVGLSPYEYPPFPPLPLIVREVGGLENFQNYDAEITVKLQGVSPLAAAEGEYSLDNGATWNTYPMAATKGTYYCSGTIPGQPDGTLALTRFNITDEAANSIVSDNYEVTWSKDNPLLNEGFEGDFPPPGWEQLTVGSGFVKGSAVANAALTHTGDAALTHWDTEFDNDDWMITPVISIPVDNSCTFSFWQNGYWMSYYVFHEVAITTDNGATWTQIDTGAPSVAPGDTSGDVGVWEQLFFTLGAYTGQDIRIGFHYMGNYVDQWYIDDVKVFYDYSPPDPVSLVGNPALLPVIGAYVNNPMDLLLTLYDVTGVASVTGHYDIGGNMGDVVFNKAKGEEVWAGTVPALNFAATGIINFTTVDIGGLTSTLSDFAIVFVTDTDPPPPPVITGTENFINNPLNIEITFYDESAIDSCVGHYSKDNWVTQYEFVMTPGKIHEYVYTGVIPAETEQVLDGKAKITIIDSAGNSVTTSDFTVKWYDGSILLTEDFESGTDNWVLTGNWGLEENTSISATHSLTESPDSVYTEDNNSSATWDVPLDLTLGYQNADIKFWCKYDIEQGFDYMHFEVSSDNGVTWDRMKTWTGEGIGWHQESAYLSLYVGYYQVKFRWVFESDGGYEVNGMNIDDISVNAYFDWNTPPIIIHQGPEFYEADEGNYYSSARVFDTDGVDSVWVEYTVDGGMPEYVSAEYDTGDYWDFTIPFYEAGSLISYSIWAVDASDDKLESHIGIFSYIPGFYVKYDSGFVSYLNTIENNDAWATYYYGFEQELATVLIRNYTDASHISSDMKVHVWEGYLSGPGNEIAVFDVTPVSDFGDPTAMTIIDFRGLDIALNGTLWIGISAPYGAVYSTMESIEDAGVTAYERSYEGTWNGTDWDWTNDSLYNYHIRAIFKVTGSIEDNTLPAVTALHQNYPNPFNPSTEISYSLNSEGMVKLSVFNTKGELVNSLVNQKKAAGNHLVNFNGDGLNSGIYFYRLSVDGKTVQSKKMMLLK